MGRAHNIFSCTSNAREVAILIKQRAPVKILHQHADVNGRFIIIHGKIKGEDYLLVNVYGPNIDDGEFFQDLFKQ